MTADTLTLLDSDLELGLARCLRTDSHEHIYVPHSAGVALIRIVDNQRLRVDRILTGDGRLKSAMGVAVVNDATLCVSVGRGDNQGVYLLDVIADTVLTVLQPPAGLEHKLPFGVAALSGSVLVGYMPIADLALFAATGETPGIIVLHTEDVTSARAVAVDPSGRFLVVDSDSNAVWVVSVTGEVLARVDSDSPGDVTLSPDNRKLYIGNFGTGEITVLQ